MRELGPIVYRYCCSVFAISEAGRARLRCFLLCIYDLSEGSKSGFKSQVRAEKEMIRIHIVWIGLPTEPYARFGRRERAQPHP